jgi:hypothetical protein
VASNAATGRGYRWRADRRSPLDLVAQAETRSAHRTRGRWSRELRAEGGENPTIAGRDANVPARNHLHGVDQGQQPQPFAVA